MLTTRSKNFVDINESYNLAPMPVEFRLSKGPKPRGVAGRNAGMKWIMENVAGDGVMYFADDDNTYDLRLFNEVRFKARPNDI